MRGGGEEQQQQQFGRDEVKIRVSPFDFSVENHVNAMETISKLCGEVERDSLDFTEIQRLYPSITFLREWKHVNYEPRAVRFAHEVESSQRKGFLGEVNLPQFSSAVVPKEGALGGISSSESRDFVIYVGGSVWALDWCPRAHERSAGPVKCEFLAVAAHPPNSYYHKVGALLTGRGVVQIWCILNDSKIEEEAETLALIKKPKGRPKKKQIEESCTVETTKRITEFKRPRGRPRKHKEEIINDEANQCKKPRGRPRKKTTKDLIDSLECHNQHPEVLSVEYPEEPAQILAIEGALANAPEETVQKNKAKKQNKAAEALSASISASETTFQDRKLGSKPKVGGKRAGIRCPSFLAQNEDQSSIMNDQIKKNLFEEPALLKCSLDNVSCEMSSDSCAIPENIVLPRLVFCLAHNGKVVWDVKWRPCHISDPKSLHRMGYLAVLLGNGSLEVWDVPLPSITNAIYSSSHREGTDPRFVKLEPVFKCSIAKGGEIESIPLTVEWSALCPHNYLLAGCHDGKVALWNFSADAISGDTRPLLCFSADTVPIRALAWAPSESDQESANIVVTAGHGGLKFWDIRDPFRPLWDLHPVPKFIYSLDWLPDPRCIILSFDDGTVRLLSLVKAAYDAHVCGKPSVGPKQIGMHVLTCPSFAIWSVQVSRKTGIVAYCSADGTVCRFQLTTKAVEKDPSRNRVPHFKIWSLRKDESAITVCTSLPDTPLSLKKPVNSVSDNSRTMRSLFESSQTKTATKAKTPAADNQPLAICYGNDPSTSGSDELLANICKQPKLKSKSTRERTAEEDLALVCIDKEQPSTPQNETSNEVEVIPPKIVAIHRVRWNPNPGSERWLSSGGAAGIVRCQEILLSDLDKDLARKR